MELPKNYSGNSDRNSTNIGSSSFFQAGFGSSLPHLRRCSIRRKNLRHAFFWLFVCQITRPRQGTRWRSQVFEGKAGSWYSGKICDWSSMLWWCTICQNFNPTILKQETWWCMTVDPRADREWKFNVYHSLSHDTSGLDVDTITVLASLVLA